MKDLLMTKTSVNIKTLILSDDHYIEALESYINSGLFKTKNEPFKTLLEIKKNTDKSYTILYSEDIENSTNEM